MVNEALLKILCHNLVVLIHEMYELGIVTGLLVSVLFSLKKRPTPITATSRSGEDGRPRRVLSLRIARFTEGLQTGCPGVGVLR